MRVALFLLVVSAVAWVGAVSAAPAPIGCVTAKVLMHSRVRPVWFPSPQPAGRLVVNASVSIFGPGLEWGSGRRYLFLGRVPGGANLGAPFPKRVADPYLANFAGKVQVWRLAAVEGGGLYADWPTRSGSHRDLSYAVARGETVTRFVAFLSSLRPIVWPTCRG